MSNPVLRFTHSISPNGLLLATCLLCAKMMASSNLQILRRAEQLHRCPCGSSACANR